MLLQPAFLIYHPRSLCPVDSLGSRVSSLVVCSLESAVCSLEYVVCSRARTQPFTTQMVYCLSPWASSLPAIQSASHPAASLEPASSQPTDPLQPESRQPAARWQPAGSQQADISSQAAARSLKIELPLEREHSSPFFMTIPKYAPNAAHQASIWSPGTQFGHPK